MNTAQNPSDLATASTAGRATAHSPRVSQEKRASALRAARNKNQVFSRDDQALAASNLHRLLEEVCATGGLTKRDVVMKAGLGGGISTDSTKRLDTYTLPDGASSSRRERLAKKPGKYFEIAEAIATLRNESSAPFICQVFEGCTFGADRDFLTRWEEERWARLAQLLRAMSVAVAKKSNIDVYWTEAAQGNGQYDHKTDQLICAEQPLDMVGCSAGLAGYQAHPGELPPIPSVLLGTTPLAEQSPAKLRFSNGEELEIFAMISLEVRLALAPVGRTGEPGPLLEFRSRLDARGKKDGELVLKGAYFDETDGVLEINGAGLVGREAARVQLTDFTIPTARYRNGCSNDYWAWEEVSPGLLQEIFGDWEAPLDMSHVRSGIDANRVPPSRFEAGTAAFFLNAYLMSGALETELMGACKSRAALLDQFRDTLDEKILGAEADANTRWRSLQAE